MRSNPPIGRRVELKGENIAVAKIAKHP